MSRTSPLTRFAALVLRRYSALLLLVVFVLVFGIVETNTFLTDTTLRLVLSNQVTVGMLALAVLVALVSGAFDLSVGANLALGMVILSWLELHTGIPTVFAALLVVLCCAFVGFINGLFVVRLRVNSFIATLGMSQVALAATLYVSHNEQIVGAFSPKFLNFAQGQWFGIGHDVYFLVALALLVWYVLEFTPAGRYAYAAGGNEEAARLAGVPTDRIVWGSLICSGAIVGFAAVVFSSRVGLFSTSFGQPLLFPAFAAVFFGSTQIKSRPNVWGTILAMYVLAFGQQGIELLIEGGSFWVSPVFQGAALLFAVTLASYRGTGIKASADEAPSDPAAITDERRI